MRGSAVQLQLALPDLPAFRTRTSTRAKHPNVTVSAEDGIVVTVPQGYDERRIGRLLTEWRPWIHRQLRKLAAQQSRLPPAVLDPLPHTIRLPAIDRVWPVSYRTTRHAAVQARDCGGSLAVVGRIADHAACRRALRRWLARQAQAHLAPWLASLGARHGLAYRRLSIRGQRTRWASCSSSGTISLNYQLLFLAPDLVNCVLLHELCHTRWMNHGPRFYALLRKLEPDYQHLDARISAAWQHIPVWVRQR